MPDIFDRSATTPTTPVPSTKSQSVVITPEARSTVSVTASAVTNPASCPPRHVDEYSEVMRAATPSTNHWSAYAPKPVNLSFDVQAANEQVILLLRRHPITQVPWIIAAAGLVLFPFFLTFFSFPQLLPDNFAFMGILLWYLIITGFVLESFLGWFFRVFIITDERVIDVDFYSLVYKDVSSGKIDNIEGISAVASGGFAAIFDYGTVEIQTAGSVQKLEFENIPHPDRVTKLLNEIILEEEREHIEGRVS